MKTRWNISYLIYYIFIALSYKSLHIFCYEVIAPSDLNSGSTELHDRILTPSTTPEVYFNGSAYIRFTIPVSLKRHIGLSFRTCTGGELFSQQYKDYSIILSVHNDRLSFIIKTPIQQYDTYIQSHRTLLDNRWHTVNIIYKFGNLTLYLDNQSQLIANSTYNEEIINNPEFYNERAVLILGKRYTGCILEGPSLVFNKTIIQSQNAVFGLCSMSTESCTVRQEMSLTPADVTTEDYCITEPCMRHGQCINHANRYECRCTARYTSKNCEVDLGSPCARKLCLNGATCTEDVTGDYKCTCLPDFTGRNCENELRIHSLCEKSPCQNNGTCMVPNGANKYECICLPGFMGAHCEVNINECLSNPCKNGGICIDGNNNFTCNCQSTGYKGHLCEQNINECEQNLCQHNGVCFDTYGGYICNCQPGFHGENCEQNINECVSSPCSNGGMCMNINNTYECHCLPGYTGNRCQDHITICLSVQCPVHSQCVETEGVAQCVCKPGYYGLPGKSPNCTESALCAANPCGNGGTCIPVRDTFECICPTGFTGPYCEGVDRCRLQPCMNEGTCIQDDYTYRCLCVEGFTGRNCEQQIRCTDKPCKYVASCKDYVGGYHCTCLPGWTGFNCDIEIDECLSLPCQNGASCINGPNEFYCHCLPGFTGKTCNYNIDDCASTPCQNGGKCIDKINGFICNCTEMWMGTICERPYNICEMLQPCQNNATCSTNIHNKKSYTCNCLPGFEGPTCAINIDDCVGVVCPIGRECVDSINSYECRCPRGFSGENCTIPVNSCADANLCVNGTCVVTDTGYKCECVQGFTGKHCEVDIDECVFPGICHNGICVNRPGDFQCYCEPGYTGDRCDTDFDECLSHPCKNGATCLNKINKFECICPPGYTSIDCSVDINECDSNPCVEGSTCINGIASYYCKCQPGLTGARCEINIDDCVSSPCLNSGLCVDGLNNYTCNCDNTGFVGDHCEINIDDCISNPCTNGAQCEDGVNNYTCKCFSGYSGKNCEIDINECLSNPCQYGGTCLQRSNTSLYQPAIQKEFAFELPRIFKSKFTYNNASGYECICVPGITGENCQININECEDNPCNNGGQCHDKIGYYVCECDPGFEGTHCEHDVDECATLKPCVHGTCIDGRANYFCDCKPEYGGKNCSVELIACKKENACLNDGKCKPYVENEVTHKYNCTCTNGFHGDRCEKITTMSLNGSSYVMVNTSRDEGYDIQFRFKTTLANGLLAIGKGLTYYILELVNRRLNLRSSLLNKWEGVFIGSALNDSNWQKVFVAINSSHLVLAANEEQTIYPINLNEASNSSHTTFPTTYLGGTVANHRHLAHSPPFFVGCMQDVVINSEWVLPENEPTALAGPVSIVNVQVGCFREPQCNPNPCHSGGHCTDLWQTFSCTCERPYLGKTCQYNFTAATFSHENTTNSLVTVTVTESAKRAVRSISHISMFIRTRQNRGQIFYLGSAITSVDLDDETYIAAQLESGELLVKIQFNKTPEAHTVGGVKLDNGYNHLIEVIRNVTLIQVKLNGTEYFRKTIGATGQLDVQMMYLGGLPQVSRPVRQADPTASATTVQHRAELNTNVTNYKGIIQDVQISNGNLTMVVEFFPLRAENLVIPSSFGSVSFEKNSILEGVISDDMCRVNPCERNGTCYNTWNDFSCHCPLGFKGKTCQEVEFCQLQDCPTGSVCRNLNDGYECIANATFDGKSTSLSYNFVTLNTTKPKFDSIEISYRTNDGGTLFHAINGQEYFIISVNRDNITTQWKLNGRPEIHKFKKDAADGNWTTLVFTIKDNILKGGFKDLMMEDMPNLIAQDFDANAFDNLISRSTIILGGGYYNTDKENVVDYDVKHVKTSYRTGFYTTENMMLGNNAVEIPNTSLGTGLDLKVGANFKGCLGEIRVGKYLLAYYLIDDLYDKNKTGPEYFSLLTNKNHNTGCLLCFDTDCKNNGHCLNPEIEYICDCPPGFEANDCSVNINECVNNLCKNNSSCIDGIANYTCKCEIGWEGWLCDQEINECLSEPCLNGGTCVDLLGSYECQCPNTYIGSQCESLRLITCDNQPCLNGSTCVDKKNLKTANNFTCICAPGFEGAFCDIPYCMISICQHGFCNVDRPSPMCECEVGFTGKYCEENINECLTPNGSSPCLNKGTCIDGIGSYTCNCNSTGYTGDTCEIDIDECTLYSEKETCGPTGKCINIPGTYKCSCPIGYCGNGCNHQNPCYILQMLEGDIEQSDFAINEELCGLHGTCNEDCGRGPNHICICEEGFGGDNCTSPEVGEQGGTSAIDIAVIVVPIMAVLLLLAAAGLAVFIAMARSKRATRGTYSPSAQEFCNPRVEMDHVLKPPPEERLI